MRRAKALAIEPFKFPSDGVLGAILASYPLKDSLEAGHYCPLPEPSLLRLRLRKGKYTFTELGLEVCCSRCRQFWPADSQFFHTAPSMPSGLSSWCIACYNEWRLLFYTARPRVAAPATARQHTSLSSIPIHEAA